MKVRRFATATGHGAASPIALSRGPGEPRDPLCASRLDRGSMNELEARNERSNEWNT